MWKTTYHLFDNGILTSKLTIEFAILNLVQSEIQFTIVDEHK